MKCFFFCTCVQLLYVLYLCLTQLNQVSPHDCLVRVSHGRLVPRHGPINLLSDPDVLRGSV